MANTDRPNGFKLVGHLRGSPNNAVIEKCVMLAATGTDTFVGDAVKLVDTGSDTTGAFPSVIQAAAAGAIFGVIVSLEFDPANLSKVYRVASTLTYVHVCTDPDALYECQDNAGATMTAADVGLNAPIVVGSGNTTTGASSMELDSSNLATTATDELKIIRILQRADNAIGDNNRLIVKINNHQRATGTGTAGV